MEVPVYGRGGVVRAYALVDAADAEQVLAHRWHLKDGGYVVRDAPRAEGRGRGKLRLHRQIMGLERGDPREVDHENGNPLDCRRSNLRVCTHAQNGQNLRRGFGTSSHRGVALFARTGRWQAYATVDGRRHHLGYFAGEEEAAAAAASWRAQHMPFSAEAGAA